MNARAATLLLSAFAAFQDEKAPPKAAIEVVPGGWGDASTDDIRAVLDSAAAVLLRNFPGREAPSIRVERGRKDPIVLFARGPRGEHVVRLNTEDAYWSQYAYQFAHELGHILCGYREGENPNKWLEESLCETASLYALRAMARTWAESPPYPNWASYAPRLREYSEKRLAATADAGGTLADWYRRNEKDLRADGTRRELNAIVAKALLPLFEEDPGRWEAVSWINHERGRAGRSLADHLRAWSGSVPARHAAFVRRLAALFDVSIP
jgi:hypothetical protein